MVYSVNHLVIVMLSPCALLLQSCIIAPGLMIFKYFIFVCSTESSVGELSKVLLLLLGCAVQCDRKQSYIQCITQLEVNVQEAIVEYIKQVHDPTIFFCVAVISA